MKLNDIDIHWIHKADVDASRILDKFNKRYELGKSLKRIFVWSAAEIFNKHDNDDRKSLINTFLSIDDQSVFLTNRKDEVFEDDKHISVFIPEWENKDEDDRRIDTILKWDDQAFISNTFRNVIEKKFS